MNSTHIRRVHTCGSSALMQVAILHKVLHAYLGTHINYIYGILLVILSVGRISYYVFMILKNFRISTHKQSYRPQHMFSFRVTAFLYSICLIVFIRQVQLKECILASAVYLLLVPKYCVVQTQETCQKYICARFDGAYKAKNKARTRHTVEE